MKYLSQKGVTHIFLLFAAVGLLLFLLISNTFSFRDRLFSNLFPKSKSEAAVTVNQYDVFEVTLTYPTAGMSNPWENATVTATFTTPSNKTINYPGFYYDTNTYKVRFNPAEVGTYNYTINISGPTAFTPQTGSFTSVASSNKGFIRRVPGSSYKLQYENGEFFAGTGFNDCWSDDPVGGFWLVNGKLAADIGDPAIEPPGESGFVDVDAYFTKNGTEGRFNLYRWNPGNCTFNIKDIISTSGNTYKVGEGKFGDQLLESATSHGFHTMFTFFYGNPPFPNATVGSAEEAAIKRYFQYALARYGAYVDVWELTNETVPGSAPDAWIDLTSKLIRSIDPYGRMITNSVPRSSDPLYLDISSPHLYGQWFYIDLYTPNFIDNKTSGLPSMPGELGLGYNDPSVCPYSTDFMRIQIWTGVMGRTAPIFWNGAYVYPNCQNMYIGSKERTYNRTLHNAVSAITDVNANSTGLSANNATSYALTSSNAVVGYAYIDPRTTASRTTNITLNVPFSGGTLTWIDTKNGNTLGTQSVSSGTQTITSPSYSIDIAFKITTSAPTPTPSGSPTPTPSGSPTPTPTPSPTPSPTPTPGPGGTVTYQISTGGDDVNEDGGAFDSFSNTVWMGTGGSATGSWTGLRFTNVTIPKGATINSAKLEVYSTQSQWIGMEFTINAENSGNSSAFSASSRPSQKVLTTQSVIHSSSTNWLASTSYQLDEMAQVIQEVVNRSDWASGNNLSVTLHGTGATFARKFISSFDGSATNAPKLIVNYSTPIPTPTPGATASPTPSPTPPPKVGDINGDGAVNVVDFSIMLSKWGTSDTSADLNGDGIVNVVDFSILLSNWGT